MLREEYLRIDVMINLGELVLLRCDVDIGLEWILRNALHFYIGHTQF